MSFSIWIAADFETEFLFDKRALHKKAFQAEQ